MPKCSLNASCIRRAFEMAIASVDFALTTRDYSEVTDIFGRAISNYHELALFSLL